MAKAVKLWVFVRDDGKYGEVRPVPPEGPSVWGGAWVEMTGELPDPEPPPLLPCPFCGGLARFIPDVPDGVVECSGRSCNILGPRRATKVEAALAWNYRSST